MGKMKSSFTRFTMSAKFKNIMQLLFLLTFGSIAVAHHFKTLYLGNNYNKDFTAIFVLINSIGNEHLIGNNIDETAHTLGLNIRPPSYPHPSPHPPTLILFLWFLRYLPYYSANWLYFFIEYASLYLGIYVLLSFYMPKKRAFRISFPLLIAVSPFWPVFYECMHTNVNLILFLLYTLCWRSFKKNKPLWGGVYLGLSLLIKQTAWPIALVLLIKKNTAGFASCVAAIATGYAVTIGIVGYDYIYRYYTDYLPSITKFYHADPYNISLSTLGYRLFQPTEWTFNIVPLLNNGLLWKIFCIAIPLCIMIAFAMLILRRNNFDVYYSLSLCASILLSPIAWETYSVFMILPIALLYFNTFFTNY